MSKYPVLLEKADLERALRTTKLAESGKVRIHLEPDEE